MGIFMWLLVGLIAGAIAKAVMPGSRKEPGGWIMTMVLGVVGAFVGGFVGQLLGFGAGSSIIGSILMAALGAIIVIGLLRLLTGSRRAV